MTTEKQTTALAKKELQDQIISHVESLVEMGSISLPKDYKVGNAMRSAFLILQDVKDRNGKPALEVCTKASVANSMLKMVTQSMNPALTQCYFMVAGNQLVYMRSYMGSIALGKRIANVKEVNANLIYKKDEYVSEIDTSTGRRRLLKHTSPFENRDDNNIIGAYAIVLFNDGTSRLEEMTLGEIVKSWEMGAAKGNSPAHKGFKGEMSKKSVIARSLKIAINSSTDSENMDDDSESAIDISQENLKEKKKLANSTEITFDDHEDAQVVEEMEHPTQEEIKSEAKVADAPKSGQPEPLFK